jgi:hypothetical protein
MHGSGTPVGDALELEGISLAVQELGGPASPFVVGSVKGNVGNTQHASGLVSLIKLCKSMQNGLVPATRGIERPNELINQHLPLRLAVKDTPVRRGHVLAVCASGWGGVNTHTLLGFPEERLQKRATVSPPSSTFSRQRLAAPRLNGLNVVVSAQSEGGKRETTVGVREIRVLDDIAQVTHSAAGVLARHAADILGFQVALDTDLRAAGLDSKSYVALVKAVTKEEGLSIGVRGLLLPICTPLTLAESSKELEPQPAHETRTDVVTSSILRRGRGASIVVLPGSGGSLAGAAPLLRKLPTDKTVMTVEHPGFDPEEGLVSQYANLIRANLEPSSSLVILAISLGGRYAPKLAAHLRQLDGWRHTKINMYMLDSPVMNRDALSSLKSSLTGMTFGYIGAQRGGLGSDKQTVAQWKAAFPHGELHDVDCRHGDLWGEGASDETVKLIAATSI